MLPQTTALSILFGLASLSSTLAAPTNDQSLEGNIVPENSTTFLAAASGFGNNDNPGGPVRLFPPSPGTQIHVISSAIPVTSPSASPTLSNALTSSSDTATSANPTNGPPPSSPSGNNTNTTDPSSPPTPSGKITLSWPDWMVIASTNGNSSNDAKDMWGNAGPNNQTLFADDSWGNTSSFNIFLYEDLNQWISTGWTVFGNGSHPKHAPNATEFTLQERLACQITVPNDFDLAVTMNVLDVDPWFDPATVDGVTTHCHFS